MFFILCPVCFQDQLIDLALIQGSSIALYLLLVLSGAGLVAVRRKE